MPVLTKFQDFTPVEDRNRVLNHAWLAKGEGETNFYYLEVDPATGALPFQLIPTSYTLGQNLYFPYSGTPVTTAAYVEIIASTTAITNRMYIQDTSGSMLILAVGAAGVEVPLVYVQAGGFGFPIDLTIAAGARVSLKALDSTASSGAFLATFLT